MSRFVGVLSFIAAGLVLGGCSSPDEATETKGSTSSHELGETEADDEADIDATDADESDDSDTADADDEDDNGGTAAADNDAKATPSDDNAATGGGSKAFDGTKVKAAGAINPPNPVDMCNEAKADAQSKATAAGYTGTVTWSHLSNDSDCSLSTQRAGSLGVFFIFTAKGTFNQN